MTRLAFVALLLSSCAHLEPPKPERERIKMVCQPVETSPGAVGLLCVEVFDEDFEREASAPVPPARGASRLRTL